MECLCQVNLIVGTLLHSDGDLSLPLLRKKRGRARIEQDEDETEEDVATGGKTRKGKKKFLSKAFVSSSESSEDEGKKEVLYVH